MNIVLCAITFLIFIKVNTNKLFIIFILLRYNFSLSIAINFNMCVYKIYKKQYLLLDICFIMIELLCEYDPINNIIF